MHPQVDRRVQSAEQAAQLLRAALAHARAPLQSPLPSGLREASSLRSSKAIALWGGLLLVVVAIVYAAASPSRLQPAASSTPQQSITALPAILPAASTMREEALQVEVTPSVEPWISGEVEQLLLESTHKIDKLRHELSGSVQMQQNSRALSKRLSVGSRSGSRQFFRPMPYRSKLLASSATVEVGPLAHLNLVTRLNESSIHYAKNLYLFSLHIDARRGRRGRFGFCEAVGTRWCGSFWLDASAGYGQYLCDRR